MSSPLRCNIFWKSSPVIEFGIVFVMASEGRGGCYPLRHSKACSMTAFGLRTTLLCMRILSINHSQRLWLDSVMLHRAKLIKQAGYT